MKHSDILIIGGGASGMMCAITAKENNPDKTVTILEKQNRIGRKILSTGNGRCNLLNINLSSENYNGSFSQYMDRFISINPAENILSYFKKLGLYTKVESEGRVYPVSNHASSVLDILRFKIESLNVNVECEQTVIEIKKDKKGFLIKADKNIYTTEKLVIATGSPASPKLGGDNSGINILKSLGHKTAPSYPALCPIKVKSSLLPSLKGLRVNGKVTLFDGESLVDEENGEIQFTENALSGICVFNLSNSLYGLKKPNIKLNLLPYEKKINKIINNQIKIFNSRNAEDIFSGIFQKKLSLAVLKEAGIKPSQSVKSLNNNQINTLSDIISGWRFEIIGAEEYNKAQVAGGGVAASELNPNTMESKIIKNLYICGEAVDIIGKCGGYNLYFAFASGKVIGENI